MSKGSEQVDWKINLAIQVGLLPLFAAILFGLFGFILPPNRWIVWTTPLLVGAGGAVAILAAWPFRQPFRAGLLDALAATLALASVIPGLAITLLVAFGLAREFAENRHGTHSLLYELTSPIVLRQIVQFALVPVVPGVIGLWLAKRLATQRTSRAAMAARFSLLSLALSAMIGCVIIIGAAYRRVEWP